ncbi:MAG TPA: ATP-binding protein [Pyrinomonadaceae bacterium]|jgi:PAS domain S-box-containing protein|nr:ATP-binding protein [Pyrinomonadaceae bacterium]
MKPKAETPITFDVRTKLLVMLAVLSLPLLIISLIQLHSYQKSLNDQATTIARIETTAAAGALEAWVEDRADALQSGASALSPAEAADIYARVRRQSTAGSDTAITVFDGKGRALAQGGAKTLAPKSLSAGVGQQYWDDGVERVTGLARAEPSGWSVAVGVPLPENTPAGRAIVILTTTWALMLLASFFLAIWAVGRFTKPLRVLAATASVFGEGKLQERVEVETDDEVGTLANSFNTMAASLETKFEQVQKQSAFIGEVLDSLPLGVVVLDASLIVRKVNSAFSAMTGRAASSLMGRGMYEAAAGLAVLSDIVEDVRRTRRAFVNYGLPLDLMARERGRAEEGQKFWDVILWPVTDRSEGRGDLILILSEVSKRVRAERLATAAFAAEKARAAELASVINQMDEGVVIVDAQGRYRVNPSAARILGREPGEFRDGVRAFVTDMALRDIGGRILDHAETPIYRALERGQHVICEQCKIMRADGDERVLAVGATPLAGEGGRTEGVVAVFRDITEEVRSHNELVEAYDRLREHDRLKSAFVASMSHELRTPLNVILGLCQLLERDPQLPLAPLQTEAVLRMERNARALLDLVNDMLEYSRLEAGRAALHLEAVSIAEAVGEVAENYAADARDKKIRIDTEVSPEVGTVQTDRRKLTQVLSSLVSNAVKFTSSGAVVISAGAVGADRWYVEVTDTGIGMSSDALTYIFDGFRQVDDRLARSYSGVGLGLAITRKIVDLLEGEITVDSKQNEGSRFRITWPREARPRTGTGSLITHSESPALAEAINRHARAG